MAGKLSIVIDDKIPFIKGILEPYANVTYIPGHEIKNEDLKKTDALVIRTRTRIDETLLKGTSIKFIASATIGFDHIDRQSCQALGVQWVNAPGCNSGSVYQYVASALSFLSNQYEFQFNEKTLGIIGVGNVGSKVEKLGKILGFRVLLNDPPRERQEGKTGFTDLDTLLSHSDIITFHVPLIHTGVDKTFEMLNGKTLRGIKTGSWIINTSRGDVIDEKALLSAIAGGTIKSAILDVWKNEPQIHGQLLEAVAIGTPHIAGYSLDGKANGTSQTVRNLADFFHLKLDLWYPENISAPSNELLEIQTKMTKRQEILKKYILATYDAEKDSYPLKNEPDHFELLRGHYPARREFHAFTVNSKNLPDMVQNDLIELGFNIR